MFFLCFLDVAVNCGSLARPSNGWIQKKTGETFGALHLFKCNEAEGYLMRGSKERRCLANATWSGVQPVCYREFSDHNLYATFLTLSCVVASFPFRRVKQQLVRKANKEPIFPQYKLVTPLVNQFTENWHQNQARNTSLEMWLSISATMDFPLVVMKLQDARFMGIGVIRRLHASVS